MQMQALNIITIYHWKGGQGVYFHLNYTSLHQKKADFRGIIPVSFLNMKENRAPAVMHMHEGTAIVDERQ